ncbi:DUF7572 family protein [Mycolicibacterium fluoranthenivorans]|uniref:DUF7572 domain-containing protein n=1 Tax=Mycolicibacterium fluoranthenivorans TaxID=258505 RepID=A0A7X5U428_9MYCO|nr:hypothetical protein [Mycolicibacterium fluoranthenivorans]MCV7358469.1 hypothetical protein [Mycolicibacterium fluoranthenivorans]NIH98045.1 hypothetical protein [Mycolicibacterium fluoranthenivorans]
METATLVTENVSHFCPMTNFYQCSDGTYLLVTIPRLSTDMVHEMLGVRVPIVQLHLPDTADVFRADADAVVLDADGDPSNGMTPLVSVPGCEVFAEALAAAGYTLTATEEA